MQVSEFDVLGLRCVVVGSLENYPAFALAGTVVIEDTGSDELNRTIAFIVARAYLARQSVVDMDDSPL